MEEKKTGFSISKLILLIVLAAIVGAIVFFGVNYYLYNKKIQNMRQNAEKIIIEKYNEKFSGEDTKLEYEVMEKSSNINNGHNYDFTYKNKSDLEVIVSYNDEEFIGVSINSSSNNDEYKQARLIATKLEEFNLTSEEIVKIAFEIGLFNECNLEFNNHYVICRESEVHNSFSIGNKIK